MFAFNEFLIKMLKEFKTKVQVFYVKNKKWIKIWETLKSDDSTFDIQFHFVNDLLYFGDFFNKIRLYLFKKFEKKIFYQTHNENAYIEFNKTYKVITNNYFFRKLTRRLHYYIHHYYKCNINQTKRYTKYDSLTSIIEPLISHHTIAVDFILTLSKTTKGINIIMLIIYKFSKRIIFIFDKNIFSTEN